MAKQTPPPQEQSIEDILQKIQADLTHIENNRRLAWRDNLGDGYEIYEYLRNLHKWMNSGLQDLGELAKHLGVALPIPAFQVFEDTPFEEDPFPFHQKEEDA